MNPNQLIPPSCVRKERVSTLLREDVNIGCMPPPHLTLEGQLITRAEPSPTNCNMKENTLGDGGIFENAKVVMFELRDTEKNVAAAKSKFKALREIEGVDFVSEVVSKSRRPVIVPPCTATVTPVNLEPSPKKVPLKAGAETLEVNVALAGGVYVDIPVNLEPSPKKVPLKAGADTLEVKVALAGGV